MSSDASSTRSAEQEDDESSSQDYSHHDSRSASRRSSRKQTPNYFPSQSQYAQHDPDLEDIFGGEPIVFDDERNSDKSDYEPSDHSSSPAPIDMEDAEAAQPESDSDVNPDVPGPSRKRTTSARPSVTSSDLNPSPLKRPKPTPPLNHAYLALLNADIEDARARYIPNSFMPLETSQIGLTVWTPPEKELFFEALGRLGRDDAPGIAARMGGSKGELEVRQYLMLLRDAVEARREAGELEPLAMEEVPAAVELSVKCCFALDEAAEGVACRVEGWEGSREDERWGGLGLVGVGDVEESGSESDEDEEGGKEVARSKTEPSDGEGAAEGNNEDRPSPTSPTDLFHVHTLLKLSSRLFMNAPFADGNWTSHSSTPPAIRTTALHDLHALTLSILRRLMSASLFIARSRVRSKSALMPWTRSVVRRRDVQAAARSIGLEIDRKAGWVGMATRLRLRVFENPPPRNSAEDVEEEEELVSRTVEEMLAKNVKDYKPTLRDRQAGVLNDRDEDEDMGAEDAADSAMSDAISSESEVEPDEYEDTSDDDPTSTRTKRQKKHDPVLWAAASAEAKEIINHSAVGYPATWDARRMLKRHIMSEMKHEVHADELDHAASVVEERNMWALLGRELPEELREKRKGKEKEVVDEGPVLKKRDGVEDLVWPAGGGGRNWREKMEWKREWEAEMR